ncbi:MAG: leucine-rich repeat domain-containing protein [Oscillospiraceae bacterium]|jgi:hypothetical protein|nr:leucine-rich repeat domain-containing protein [Oscillospiraceae bacterium]
MKTRILLTIIALSLALSLAACGGGGSTYESEPETRRTATSDAAPTTTPSAPTAEPPATTTEPPRADLSKLSENPETDFEFKLNPETDGIEIIKYIGTETKVRIPETIYEKPVKIIAAGVFYDNWTIEQVYIPDTVTELADSAFYGCGGLTDVRLPDGLTNIGNETFYGCKSLTGITIPDKVTSIGNEAFSGIPDITVSYKGAVYGGNGDPSIVLAAVINTGSEIINFGGYDWLVLEKKDGRALILSLYVLEYKAYNDEYTDVTWETCTLRTYLNFNFYNSFGADDKAKIAETRVINNDNPNYGTSGGNDTTDKIFLLSIDEANEYFSDGNARVAYNSKGNASDWWLRSPGINSYYAAYVYDDGLVYVDGIRVYYSYGVRPALWLNL